MRQVCYFRVAPSLDSKQFIPLGKWRWKVCSHHLSWLGFCQWASIEITYVNVVHSLIYTTHFYWALTMFRDFAGLERTKIYGKIVETLKKLTSVINQSALQTYRILINGDHLCCYNNALVAQLHPTLWDPMDCSPRVSSVHGILQARILEWVAISFFRESSWPRDWTHIFCISCIGRIVYH